MYGKRKFKVSVGDRKYQVEVEEIDVSSMRESEIMEETEEKDWGDMIIPDPVVKKVGEAELKLPQCQVRYWIYR